VKEIEADVMSIQDALKLADNLELDLVEISPKCRSSCFVVL